MWCHQGCRSAINSVNAPLLRVRYIRGAMVTDLGSGEASELPCDLLLLCDTRNADPFVFRAVNETGLVYDGRLVVDAGFRTADSRIFAGGPLAKFSRSFRNNTCHDTLSSRVRLLLTMDHDVGNEESI
jgi:hypothetical protein